MTIARHDPYTYRDLIRFNMHNRFCSGHDIVTMHIRICLDYWTRTRTCIILLYVLISALRSEFGAMRKHPAYTVVGTTRSLRYSVTRLITYYTYSRHVQSWTERLDESRAAL